MAGSKQLLGAAGAQVAQPAGATSSEGGDALPELQLQIETDLYAALCVDVDLDNLSPRTSLSS